MAYRKLFGSILYSTVWREPMPTKIVWLTMLAMGDQDGIVHASVPGLAAAAVVTRKQCDAALACFLAPDPDSRSKEFEGRRIESVDGGWRLLNDDKYRDMLSPDDIKSKAAERQQRARDRRKGLTGDRKPPLAIVRDREVSSAPVGAAGNGSRTPAPGKDLGVTSRDVCDDVTRVTPSEVEAEAQSEVRTDQTPAPSPPHAFTPNPPPEPGRWRGGDWYRKFLKAWCEKYSAIWMAGSRASTEAMVDLDKRLQEAPPEARRIIETRAAHMFKRYLDDDSPDLVKKKHPWTFFVHRFDELAVDDVKPAFKSRYPNL